MDKWRVYADKNSKLRVTRFAMFGSVWLWFELNDATLCLISIGPGVDDVHQLGKNIQTRKQKGKQQTRAV